MFYQTQYTDPDTGDVLMQARWYSPGTATFRSRDTYAGDLNTPVSLNRFTYAHNNPIRYWDVTGRCVNPDRCLRVAQNGGNAEFEYRRGRTHFRVDVAGVDAPAGVAIYGPTADATVSTATSETYFILNEFVEGEGPLDPSGESISSVVQATHRQLTRSAGSHDRLTFLANIADVVKMRGAQAPLGEVLVGTNIDDPTAWCGIASCPEEVGPNHVFADDNQAIAFLNSVVTNTGTSVYSYADSAINSEQLWAHYTTPNGHAAVRWRPGAGWVRRNTGLQAGQALQLGKYVKRGGYGLIVVGSALTGLDQWNHDDGAEPGVRVLKTTVAAGTSGLFTLGGASAGSAGAGAFCASTATISCGGPWGTAAVVGIGGLVGGFIGNRAGEVVVEELLR